MKHDTMDSPQVSTPHTHSVRKAYAKPRLVVFGNLTTLTNDAGTNQSAQADSIAKTH